MTVSGQTEKALFNWYRGRTATKIPGAFISEFWTVLLPQASHSEPAVLHALLALSAVHFDGTSQNDTVQDGIAKNRTVEHGPRLERLTLEHYNYAIHHLKEKSPIQIGYSGGLLSLFVSCSVLSIFFGAISPQLSSTYAVASSSLDKNTSQGIS